MNNRLKSSLILLDNVFFGYKKYTRKTFAEKLFDEELPNSKDSITRTLNYIELHFGIKLHFKRNNKIQLIEKESNPDFFEKFQLLKGLLFTNLLNHLANDDIKLNHYISFTQSTTNKNIKYIQPLLDQIIQHKKVNIVYKPFNSNNSKKHLLNPQFLKEYLGRWYLIADTDKIQNQVFALDRIFEMELLDNTFSPRITDFHLYNNTIGVNYSEPVEDVLLWVASIQVPYFETLPIHSSQTIFDKNENGAKLSIRVSLNYELEQKILFFGDHIKVLSPEKLKTRIVERLNKTKKLYED